MTARRRIGIGVVGFGWMGQAHSRSAARIASLFPERAFDTDLLVCADNVAVRREHRGTGIGAQLMQHLIKRLRNHPKVKTIAISAQIQALPFYEKLGFIAEGEEYLDADIPHRKMVLNRNH